MNEEEAFSGIKSRILTERQLDLTQYKENYLKRRIAVRMRALQLKEYAAYLEYLDAHNEEYNVLFDKLTVNVTQFFRDPEVFIELENEILPSLFKEGKKEIRVWSAGCSSGEEPYSIAISIEESKEKHAAREVDYEIYATDLDDLSLYRAIEGKYEEKTMENIASVRRDKYFSRADESRFAVKENIKKKIKFIRLNLMDPFKENFFDIVFCRNVIIYFTKELQKKVMQFFYDSLKRGGILYLGKTETMLLDFRDRFKCINVKERIFRKIGE